MLDSNSHPEPYGSLDHHRLLVLKHCKTCGEDKPIEEFHKHAKSSDGHQHECKACQTSRAKKWRRANPASASASSRRHREKLRDSGELAERTRRYNLKSTYGITPEQYDEMLASQNGVCAICQGPPALSNNSGRFHVDHDHETGRVRGLLCGHCNTGMGMYRDSIALLWKAMLYLVRHRG